LTALSTPVLSLLIRTCTCSSPPPDTVGLGASNWKVTPGMRLLTVFEVLVRLTPSTVRLAFAPVTVEA
jgi:hypothetical protein